MSHPAVEHHQPALPTMAETEALLARIDDRVLTEDDLAAYVHPSPPVRPAVVAPADQDLKVHNNTSISFRELVKIFTACGVPGVTVKSLRAIKDRWGAETATNPALLGFPVRVRDILLARVLLEIARTSPVTYAHSAEALPADARWARDLEIKDACAAIWDTRPHDDRPDARVLIVVGERVIVLTTLVDLPVSLNGTLPTSALVMPIGSWADALHDHMDTYRPPTGYKKPR